MLPSLQPMLLHVLCNTDIANHFPKIIVSYGDTEKPKEMSVYVIRKENAFHSNAMMLNFYLP